MNLIKYKRDNDWFNDTFKSLFNSPFFTRDEVLDKSSFTPRVRITEDKDNFFLNLEMPGIPKEEVKIALEDNTLTISGMKKHQNKTEDTNLIMNEIFYGEFSRSFNLSEDIKKDNIDAEFKDGLLIITLPKKEEVKPVVKEIKVK
ncbi:MAG: Hsp20/alpha crystallin family protein [Ignavibacteriae bacterium]|nr:Hsp20/alpha crystallin family protein [Ignavibacteriota bacterium]